jgi:hypothetical protein
MGKLITLNGIGNDDVLNSLFDKEIFIYEDVQGSKIWVNWNGTDFEIRPKSVNSEAINLVDLAMQNYYNPALKYLYSLSDRVKSLLNKKWWFCFEYFADNQPANIEYARIPKNGLVLTTIFKGSKYDLNLEELDEYARLLDVDMIPVIFSGKLTETMKEAIMYFIHTSESDLDYVFGEKSFAYFFYKILNPKLENSFLMNDDFQDNLEKLIIRTSDGDVSFQLLNPLYKRISEGNNTEFVEIYTLILVNFLNFCQSIELSDIKLKGDKKDEVYIYLICKLFNIYVSEIKQDILDFDFTVPDFFDKEKFKINTELIKNKLTRELISESEKLEYTFKVILGSLNKKRKKPIGIFTENTVSLFNKFVEDIDVEISKYLGKAQEIELGRAGLLDFGDFFEIQYDTDSEEQVYPDVYSEFEKGSEVEKKKKKGGKLPIPGESKDELK